MEPARLDPFRQALIHVRHGLRSGDLRPGARMSVKAIADTLTLSPTPVREALSRLAGERLLEARRGEGYFVPALAADDIAALYRLSEQILRVAQGEPRARPGATETGAAPPIDASDPVEAVDRLFRTWAGASASRVLADSFHIVALRLAPVRRCEPQVLPDLAAEAQQLLDLAHPGARRRRGPALHAFHARRIAVAETLAQRVRPAAPDGDDERT